uniref:Spt4/RpoE2 zinc finger domain-containing protein n=1 Tax=Trypanosoma congolense (strain IL3000) TaxID=1068625 RepID=G0UUU7_TRYCI|nr:conserved hypothetical protein [Trypanosoma congolense IL3000]
MCFFFFFRNRREVTKSHRLVWVAILHFVLRDTGVVNIQTTTKVQTVLLFVALGERQSGGVVPVYSIYSMSGPLEVPPQLPIGDRGYLACRQCRLIITEQQFLRDGCSICGTGPVSREELPDVATAEFSNFIGLIAPEKSWVGRLIQRTDCPNGVFATELCEEGDEDEEDPDDGNSYGGNDGDNLDAAPSEPETLTTAQEEPPFSALSN